MFSQQVTQLLRPVIAGRYLRQHDLHDDKLGVDPLIWREISLECAGYDWPDPALSISQPRVMGADVANVIDAVQPRNQDRMR